jgi:hypothetical protein
MPLPMTFEGFPGRLGGMPWENPLMGAISPGFAAGGKNIAAPVRPFPSPFGHGTGPSPPKAPLCPKKPGEGSLLA